MRVTVELTVICTIEDPFLLMQQARDEVDEYKPLEERETYYPKSLTDAVMQKVRTAIANDMLANPAVTLHEIGQSLKELDLPIAPPPQ